MSILNFFSNIFLSLANITCFFFLFIAIRRAVRLSSSAIASAKSFSKSRLDM